MKKKFSIVMSMILSATMVFSACSTGANGTSESKAPESAPATTAAESKAPETTEAASDGPKLEGELNYWSMWNETDNNALVIKEAADEFMAQNPGTKININWQGRDIRSTIKAALDANQVDLWDNAAQLIGRDYKDYAIDLKPYVEKAWPSTDGKPYIDSVQMPLFEALYYYSGGDMVGIPFQPDVMPLWYNKDHFEKAGITAMPTTMQELLDVCAKLKEAGFIPMTVDDGYSLLPFTMYVGRKIGVEKASALVQDKTGAGMDDPAFIEAAKYWETVAKSGYFPETVASNKYPAGQNEFASGEVSMYLVPSYMVNEVREIAGEDFPWGAMELPSPEGAALPNTATIFGAQFFMITKNCANPDLAFAFLAHLTSAKWDAEASKRSMAIPTLATTEWPADLSVTKEVLQNVTQSIPWASDMNANADFTPTFKELLTKLYSGQITADQFVADCKTAVKGG